MRIKLFTFIIILGIGFLSFNQLSIPFKQQAFKFISNPVKKIIKDPDYFIEVPNYIINDSIHYFHTKQSLSFKKSKLKNAYLKANSSKEKNIILEKTAKYLYQNLTDSIIPYWYGTPWDYNGVTQKPGKGKIACGYFVFTLMKDAGFKLPRIKMSQAASEQAIKSIVSKTQIKRFSNISLSDFNQAMKDWGNGIYLIGLDNHIGFIQVKEKNIWFIHSTVIYPSCVIKEEALSSIALESSNYRIVGKISDYNNLTLKWLLDEYIPL